MGRAELKLDSEPDRVPDPREFGLFYVNPNHVIANDYL